MSSDRYFRHGFTLIEVVVCGAVLSFSVLTALAIIPRGLIVMNQARMRTVASATIVYLASDSFGKSITSGMQASSKVTPASVQWVGSDESKPLSTATIWRIKGMEGTSTSIYDGRLERRIIYTAKDSASQTTEYTAWLLNKDATQSPTIATYLATYVEAKVP